MIELPLILLYIGGAIITHTKYRDNQSARLVMAMAAFWPITLMVRGVVPCVSYLATGAYSTMRYDIGAQLYRDILSNNAVCSIDDILAGRFNTVMVNISPRDEVNDSADEIYEFLESNKEHHDYELIYVTTDDFGYNVYGVSCLGKAETFLQMLRNGEVDVTS